MRLALAPTDRASIRTATLNRPVDLFIPGEMTRIAEGRVSSDERQRLTDKLTRLHDWFLEGSRREARAGARLIVWPETNLLIFKEDEPAFLARAQRLAADERVYLAMGMGTVQPRCDVAAREQAGLDRSVGPDRRVVSEEPRRPRLGSRHHETSGMAACR